MIQFFSTYDNVFYTIAAICFILGLKKLSHPRTARKGNFIAILGMFIAIVIAIFVGTTKHDIEQSFIITGIMIGAAIGIVIAIKIQMTSIPQMVAAFNGFGGAASALIAAAEFYKFKSEHFGTDCGVDCINETTLMTIMFSIIIGTLTFTGSFVAFGKLQGLISGQPIQFKGQKIFNALLRCS